MPSLKLSLLATAVALFSAVRADYYIDPSSVSLSTRKYWCANEISTCPLICQQTPPGTTKVNTCDSETLTYGCICGNGLQPNVSEYSLTLPYYVCEEWGNQCVTNCGSDNSCSSDCRQNHPCGAQDPTRANSTASGTAASDTASATASATTSAGQVFTGFGSSSSPTSSSSSTSSSKSMARPAVDAMQPLIFMMTLGGLAAGMALVL